MNQEDLLFSDYKCLFNTQIDIILERITLRGLNRLPPFEISDVRLVRSKNQFIHTIVTFHFQWTRWIISSGKCSPTKFNRIQMRKIYSFIQIIQILDITVDNDLQNTLLPNSMEFKFGRSIHYQYHIDYTLNFEWRPVEIIWNTFNLSNFDSW